MGRLAVVIGLAAVLASAPAAAMAGDWVQIVPEDPFAASGSRNYYDAANTYRDRLSSWVVTRIAFITRKPPAPGSRRPG